MNIECGGLESCLKALRLSSFVAHLPEVTARAESQAWSYRQVSDGMAPPLKPG